MNGQSDSAWVVIIPWLLVVVLFVIASNPVFLVQICILHAEWACSKWYIWRFWRSRWWYRRFLFPKTTDRLFSKLRILSGQQCKMGRLWLKWNFLLGRYRLVQVPHLDSSPSCKVASIILYNNPGLIYTDQRISGMSASWQFHCVIYLSVQASKFF